jgi:Rrf2 family transcriptional regulator, iron-sulfur cluster assembly transcription factor
MRLTTKGRYAVTAILDLAIHNDQGPISLAEISARQNISLSYLEQLFASLRRKGLVASTRGPGGGYSLNSPADEISIADVITAVDEKLDTMKCGGSADCQNNSRCLTHDLWCDLSTQIQAFLSEITLGNLMSRNGVKDVANRQDKVVQQALLQRAAGSFGSGLLGEEAK